MPAKRKRPYTRKAGRTRKHVVRRKVAYRKKRKLPFAKGKGGRTVAVKRYHQVFGRAVDKERFIFKQTLLSNVSWQPIQVVGVGGALFDHGDGWAISMNTLGNNWGLGGNIGVNNGGIPVNAPPVPHLTTWNLNGTSGAPSQPDGTLTAFNRYQHIVVHGGVFELMISQDSGSPGSLVQGSIKAAVCGFPSTVDLSNIGGVASGHVMYPTSIAGGAQDEQSYARLIAEPNCKKAEMGPFASSKTSLRIRYPFKLSKFVRPYYASSALFYNTGVANSGVQNPSYDFAQPFMLCQLLCDGNQPMTLRVEQRITWYAYAFDRRLDYQVT